MPWVINFLSNRANVSDITKPYLIMPSLHAGVPQGTKIGPITSRQSSMMQPMATSLITGNNGDDLFAENCTCNERDNLQVDLDEFLNWSLT